MRLKLRQLLLFILLIIQAKRYTASIPIRLYIIGINGKRMWSKKRCQQTSLPKYKECIFLAGINHCSRIL